MNSRLYDAVTNEDLGEATAEQVDASDAANEDGVILIDEHGHPVAIGSWDEQHVTTQRVYTERVAK